MIIMNNIRTSYADRDAVIERLRVAAGDGMLTTDELDARIEAASKAMTFTQLAGLTADLPQPPVIVPARTRMPWTGGVLSAFVPGLGSMVNGRLARGLVILGVWFAIMLVGGSLSPNNPWVNLLVPFWFGVWVFAIVDGVRSVRHWNAGRAS